MSVQDAASLWRQMRANRTGLLIGALFGFWTGGLFGLLFGGALGFWIQRRLGKRPLHPQQAFFAATFSVMGKVAKADGRVTETEIQYARDVMARLNLNEAKRQEAIALFGEGKQADFDIASVLTPLARALRFRPELKLMFLEIQLQAAFADGELSGAEQQVLQQVCQLLQVSYADLEQVVGRSRAEQAFHQHSHEYHRRTGQGWQRASAPDEQALLQDAYGVLGVAASASDSEIKKAYRRLISQHHPDKLVARGLPEEMMQLAKEKTQEIQAAYERIKTTRRR